MALNEYRQGYAIRPSNYKNRIQKIFGSIADSVLEQSPLSNYSRANIALAAPQTDRVFVCPALRKAQLLKTKVPAYYYEFVDQTMPVYQHKAPIPNGAYHSGEIQYLFKNFNGARGRQVRLNDQQKALSSYMIGYWTMFARDGNPNSGASPQWPRFSNDQYMSLNIPKPQAKTLASLRDEHHCDFWDSGGRP